MGFKLVSLITPFTVNYYYTLVFRNASLKFVDCALDIKNQPEEHTHTHTHTQAFNLKPEKMHSTLQVYQFFSSSIFWQGEQGESTGCNLTKRD